MKKLKEYFYYFFQNAKKYRKKALTKFWVVHGIVMIYQAKILK